MIGASRPQDRFVGDSIPSQALTDCKLQVGLNGRVINQPRGKVVGGSSAVNSHSVIYPSKEYHDEWKKLGVIGWSWPEIAPYYQRFQTLDLPSQEIRDTLHLDYIDHQQIPKAGPVHTSVHYQPKPIQITWVETYEALGCVVKKDPIQGTAVDGLTIPNAIDSDKGERSHAGVAYLKPALKRQNIELITDALVEKLIFNGRIESDLVATGVQYVKNGQRYTAKARREIVICAGAFKSPQILELSGIGGKSLLNSHGIECLLDNPSIGGLNHCPTPVSPF